MELGALSDIDEQKIQICSSRPVCLCNSCHRPYRIDFQTCPSHKFHLDYTSNGVLIPTSNENTLCFYWRKKKKKGSLQQGKAG